MGCHVGVRADVVVGNAGRYTGMAGASARRNACATAHWNKMHHLRRRLLVLHGTSHGRSKDAALIGLLHEHYDASDAGIRR